jgi:hypothetical protein
MITSYNAVPPHGARRAMALARAAWSVDLRAGVKMVSLNASTVT